MAMLATSRVTIQGQGVTVDASDDQVQAAMALLLSNASAQAARAAAVAAAAEASEVSDISTALGSEDVTMENVGQPDKRKAENPLEERQAMDPTGGDLAECLARACADAAASIAAQGLHGANKGK